MLYIFDTVHMTININITIFCLIISRYGFITDFNSARFLYRTLLVTYIINYTSPMKRQQICRFTGFHTYHSPYGTRITNRFTIFIQNREITISEKTIYILHPSLHTKRFILKRQFFQFYC